MPKVQNLDEIEDKVRDPEQDTAIKETFAERMRRVFKPTDTVQVKNICEGAVEWIYLEEDKEEYTIEDDSNIKLTTREKPDLWRIDSNDIDVLDGACAYRCLEAMFKQMCYERDGSNPHPLDEGQIIHYQFDDPTSQQRFFKRAYLGKITPTMMKEAALREMARTEEEPDGLDKEQAEPAKPTEPKHQLREPAKRGVPTGKTAPAKA